MYYTRITYATTNARNWIIHFLMRYCQNKVCINEIYTKNQNIYEKDNMAVRSSQGRQV